MSCQPHRVNQTLPWILLIYKPHLKSNVQIQSLHKHKTYIHTFFNDFVSSVFLLLKTETDFTQDLKVSIIQSQCNEPSYFCGLPAAWSQSKAVSPHVWHGRICAVVAGNCEVWHVLNGVCIQIYGLESSFSPFLFWFLRRHGTKSVNGCSSCSFTWTNDDSHTAAMKQNLKTMKSKRKVCTGCTSQPNTTITT